MNRLRAAILLLAALPLAGCQALSGRSPEQLAAIVAATDWSRTRDAKIELHDSGFLPGELQLEVGQPYRLTVLNAGVNNHYFNAPEFLASIAVRKAEVPRYAEVKAPRFSSFEVYAAGGQVDIWFVPLERGRFRAFCHLGGHAEMGVEGHLVVR